MKKNKNIDMDALDRQILLLEEAIDQKMEYFDPEVHGLGFDDFCKYREPEQSELSALYRTKRFHQEPVFEDLDDIGDMFSIKEFKAMCECGGFIDYDGHGYYCKDGKQSDVMVKPSDVKHDAYREDEFDSVMWYNR